MSALFDRKKRTKFQSYRVFMYYVVDFAMLVPTLILLM